MSFCFPYRTGISPVFIVLIRGLDGGLLARLRGPVKSFINFRVVLLEFYAARKTLDGKRIPAQLSRNERGEFVIRCFRNGARRFPQLGTSPYFTLL